MLAGQADWPVTVVANQALQEFMGVDLDDAEYLAPFAIETRSEALASARSPAEVDLAKQNWGCGFDLPDS